MPQYKIEAATGQHLGDRPEQLDRVAVFGAPKAPGYAMAVIADSMDKTMGDALAAEQVIRTARQAFELFSPQTDDVASMLATIAHDAHTLIRLAALSAKKESYSSMTALVITPNQGAFWSYVGHSRLYRFDGPNFAEHTAYRSLKAASNPDLQASMKHELALFSNEKISFLGNDTGTPDVRFGHRNSLKAGDAFLLCTDGFWPYFDEAELGAAIAVNPPRQASEMLIAKARERSAGKAADNCSLAIVKLSRLPQESKNYSVGKMRRAV